MASLERVQELLDTAPTIRDRPGAMPLGPVTGSVELRRVSFTYGTAEVLRGVDLLIEPGKFTAIVGPNGSGKSTLLRLMVRLCEPDEGDIRVGGVPLAEATLASIHGRMALVPQRAVLFSQQVVGAMTEGAHL